MGKLFELMKENNLSIESSPQGTDKGHYHSYIDDFYQHLFNSMSKNPISVFEIGIQYKASLVLWKLYFPLSYVSGCDIDLSQGTHPLANLMIAANEIYVVEGDAYSNPELIPGDTDLIIDDGPHTIESQVKILSLREKLSKDGSLVIEDLGDGGGPIYCFKKLLESIPKRERKKSVCIDLSPKKGRWDDAIFIYSNDQELLDRLKKELREYHIPNSHVNARYNVQRLTSKFYSLRKLLLKNTQ
jgi:hypothetical protein